jgi:predicted dehydrogenase
MSQEKAKKRLRFGVIGYGYWGPQLVRNLNRPPTGEVAFIADLSAARREAAQLEHPTVEVTDNVERLLESDVDGVIIATPIRTHFTLAVAALEHEKHVFVEKPLTARTSEAQELLRLADERGRVLMVGHTYLYNPAVENLRQIAQSGALGRIYYADSIRANLGLFQKDINVVWDLAPHDLSILNYVLNATPLRVSVHGAAYVRPGIEDVAHLTLAYPDGVMAHVHVSWLSPSKERRFTLVGDRQMVVYDDVAATEKIRVFNRGIEAPDYTSTFGEFQLSYRYGDIVIPHIGWSEPLSVECRHFADAILEGKSPRSDAQNGLDIVRVLAAADKSLRLDGAFVELEQGDHEAGARG